MKRKDLLAWHVLLENESTRPCNSISYVHVEGHGIQHHNGSEKGSHNGTEFRKN